MSVKGIRIFLLLAEDVHKFYQYDQIKVYINTNKLNLWNFENESCIKIHQLRTTLISNSYICIILVNNKNFWQVGKDKWSLQSNTHTLTAYSTRTLGIWAVMLNLKNCIIYATIHTCTLQKATSVSEVHWFVDSVLFIIENSKIDFCPLSPLLNKILPVSGGKEKYLS